MKKYTGVDIVKFLLAIAVIASHAGLYEGSNPIIKPLYDIMLCFPVPFFFLASGFFLYKEDNLEGRLKDRLKSLIKCYLCWNIVYLPISIYDYVVKGYSVAFSILHYIRGVFLIGEHFFSWPFWYLLSFIYSLIGLIILKKLKLSDKKIFIITFLIFLFSITMDYLINNNVSNIFVKAFDFVFSTGRLFYGIFYITCGMFIKKYKVIIPKKILILPIVSMLVVMFFYFNEIARLILNIPFFLLIIQFNPKKIDTTFFRKSSMIFYYTHMINLFIYLLIVGHEACYGLDGFLICLVACFVESIIIIKIQKKHNVKLLSLLFG